MSNTPIYKLVSRQWKVLPDKGDDISIKDPKLGQGYLGDLKKKTFLELEEILKRNEQVLANKSLVSKLKDKGRNLQAHQNEVTQALEEAREKERLLKGIPNQNNIHGFEWTGSLTNNSGSNNEQKETQNLEDEELDPLKLMAHHSLCVEYSESTLSRLTEEDPLSVIVKELEQLEINDSKQETNTQEVPKFGAKRDKMFQEKYKQNGPARESFKPFRPVSHPKPIPGLSVRQKPVKCNPVIRISQEESQKLEKEYFGKEKESELKLTIKGLARQNKVSDICQLPTNPVGKYRDTSVLKHILESDEEEEEEEEAEEDIYQLGILDDGDDDGSCY